MPAVDGWLRTQLAVDTVTWTAVTVPVGVRASACYISAPVAASLKTRTNDTDATTQETHQPGAQLAVAVPLAPMEGYQPHYRFQPGQVVIYAQVTSGVGPLVISWFS